MLERAKLIHGLCGALLETAPAETISALPSLQEAMTTRPVADKKRQGLAIRGCLQR
jgi:hypothetical protein